MAEVVIKKWKCDRCHVIMDKWSRPVPHIEVSICQDYDVGPGPRIIWKEMCQSCTDAVSRELTAMQGAAIAARSALASIEGKEG